MFRGNQIVEETTLLGKNNTREQEMQKKLKKRMAKHRKTME